jgi:hypothetical protein
MCVMSLNSVDDKDSIHEALYRLTDHGSTNEDELSKHDTPWSCTVHRLCTYATPGNQSSSAILENIRSHTDLQRWCPCLVSLDSSSGIFRATDVGATTRDCSTTFGVAI